MLLQQLASTSPVCDEPPIKHRLRARGTEIRDRVGARTRICGSAKVRSGCVFGKPEKIRLTSKRRRGIMTTVHNAPAHFAPAHFAPSPKLAAPEGPMAVTSVPVARSSAVLTSQATGGAVVYWTAASTYASFQLAVAMLLTAYAVVLNNAKYRIRGQYSVDGTTWLNLGSDGYIDGLSAARTATGAFSYQYGGEQSEFGALLRVGIEVASVDGTTQGFAQINLDAVPLSTALVSTTRLASAVAMTAASGSPVQFGSNVAATPFERCRVNVALNSNAADTLTIYVKTGKADNLVTGATGTVTTADRSVSVELTTLGDVVAVYYKNGGAGGWTAIAATVDITVRPA